MDESPAALECCGVLGPRGSREGTEVFFAKVCNRGPKHMLRVTFWTFITVKSTMS